MFLFRDQFFLNVFLTQDRKVFRFVCVCVCVSVCVCELAAVLHGAVVGAPRHVLARLNVGEAIVMLVMP